MKKYRITGKSYYQDALKHRVKETDSKEEAEEIYERFCRKYFDVKVYVEGVYTKSFDFFINIEKGGSLMCLK